MNQKKTIKLNSETIKQIDDADLTAASGGKGGSFGTLTNDCAGAFRKTMKTTCWGGKCRNKD